MCGAHAWLVQFFHPMPLPAASRASFLQMEQLRQEIEQKNSQVCPKVGQKLGNPATALLVCSCMRADASFQCEPGLHLAVRVFWLQLQRMPKPGVVRAGTPPGFGLPPAPLAHLAAASAAAGPTHVARSMSLPTASDLAGGSTDPQEPQAQQRQQQHAPPSRPRQLGKQRSDAGPSAGKSWPRPSAGGRPNGRIPAAQGSSSLLSKGGACAAGPLPVNMGFTAAWCWLPPAGRVELASGALPATSVPEQQDAAAAADAFLLSLQARNPAQPALGPAAQGEPGLLCNTSQRQEQHGAAPSHEHRRGHSDAPDPLAGGPPGETAASRQPATDPPAESGAGAASSLAQAAPARASPARAATTAVPAAPEAASLQATAPAAAADPASPVHRPGALSLAQQPDPGAGVGHGAAGADARGAVAAEEAAEGRPVALLPAGLLQALLPAERRLGAAAELASVRVSTAPSPPHIGTVPITSAARHFVVVRMLQ